MYLPRSFAVDDAFAQDVIRQFPFGTLVTPGHVDPLPFTLDLENGRLVGHLARQNPHARQDGQPATVVFTGPQGYISPRWYVSPGQVPTWNYVTVVVHGRLRVHTDVVPALTQLVAAHEPADGWVFDPAAHQALLGAIVAVEVQIERIEAKAKLSQNRVPADQAGALAGLRASGDPEQIRLADWMERQLIAR